MFFAIALFLLQPQGSPPPSISAENAPLVEPASSVISGADSKEENSVAVTPTPADAFADSEPEAMSAALPDKPVPRIVLNDSAPNAFLRPAQPMTVSVKELAAENRRNILLWGELTVATHAATTFDAWTTRHAITTSGARELDPLLRPFAGNASLYAAMQVAPALMDYAGRKMMYSPHSWARRFWWIPQSASIASSLVCGSHNLAVE